MLSPIENLVPKCPQNRVKQYNVMISLHISLNLKMILRAKCLRGSQVDESQKIYILQSFVEEESHNTSLLHANPLFLTFVHRVVPASAT